MKHRVAWLRAHRSAPATLDLTAVRRELQTCGPTRVVCEEDGYGTTPERAARLYCALPDVVFVRYDGWTLGAPEALEPVARRLWADAWVAIARAPDFEVRPLPEDGRSARARR